MSISDQTSVSDAAARVAALLRSAGQRLVLAESCTGGLVAATLAAIPGISEHLCGSAVVYRNATKSAWLGIDPDLLDDQRIGPVSEEVTRALALAVLERTPEADLSAAVTGHLGPDAPPGLDGTVFVSVAACDSVTRVSRIVSEKRSWLAVRSGDPGEVRLRRQQLAVKLVLNALMLALGDGSATA